MYVLYSLIKKKLKKIIGRKKDRAEKHDSRMQIMISKTMTRKTLYVHVVLNGVILKQIYMVLFYMLEKEREKVSEKVSKKIIGNFYFWGITLKWHATK